MQNHRSNFSFQGKHAYESGARYRSSNQEKRHLFYTPRSVKNIAKKIAPKTLEEVAQMVKGILKDPNNIPADTYKRILQTSIEFAPKSLRVELLKQTRSGSFLSSKEMSTKYRIIHALHQFAVSYLINFVFLTNLELIFGVDSIGTYFSPTVDWATRSGVPEHVGKQAMVSFIIQGVLKLSDTIVSSVSISSHFENYLTSDSGLLKTLQYESDTKDLMKKIKNHPLLSNNVKRKLLNDGVARNTYYFNFYGLKGKPVTKYISRIGSNFANQLRAPKKIRVYKVIERMKNKGFSTPMAYIIGGGYKILNEIKGFALTALISQSVDELNGAAAKILFKKAGKTATKAAMLACFVMPLFSAAQDTFNTFRAQSAKFPANIALRQSINVGYFPATLLDNPGGIGNLFSKEEFFKYLFLSAGRSIGRMFAEGVIKREFLKKGGVFLSDNLEVMYPAIRNYLQQETKMEIAGFIQTLIIKAKSSEKLEKNMDQFNEKFNRKQIEPFTIAQLKNGITSTYLEILAVQKCLDEYIKFLNDNPGTFKSENIKNNCILNLLQHKTNLQKLQHSLVETKKILVGLPTYKIDIAQKNATQVMAGAIISFYTYHADYTKITTIIEQEHANKYRRTLGYSKNTDLVTVMSDPRLAKTIPSKDTAFKGININNIKAALGEQIESHKSKSLQMSNVVPMPTKLSSQKQLWFSLTGRGGRNKKGAINSSKQIDINKMVEEGVAPHGKAVLLNMNDSTETFIENAATSQTKLRRQKERADQTQVISGRPLNQPHR